MRCGSEEISCGLRGESQSASWIFGQAVKCDTEWKCPGEEERAMDCCWLLPGGS